MEWTKEHILSEYKKLKLKKGKPPNSKTFYEETSVSRHAAELAFGSKAFSKIQETAGDKPNVFGVTGRNPDEFFETYGRVARELQDLPPPADWLHKRIKPTVSAYRSQLNNLMG